jgi:hypothetical protein
MHSNQSCWLIARGQQCHICLFLKENINTCHQASLLKSEGCQYFGRNYTQYSNASWCAIHSSQHRISPLGRAVGIDMIRCRFNNCFLLGTVAGQKRLGNISCGLLSFLPVITLPVWIFISLVVTVFRSKLFLLSVSLLTTTKNHS